MAEVVDRIFVNNRECRCHVNILCEEDLGVVDFYPSHNVAVLYVSESDIIGRTSYKRKLAKLRKANRCKVVVLGENTSTSVQYYASLQRFVMLELGFVLIPVSNQTEAASLIIQMVNVECKPDINPFLKKRRLAQTTECSLLDSLQCIPKLGGVKAKLLLEKFGSLDGVFRASTAELAQVIGQANAVHVRRFLDT